MFNQNGPINLDRTAVIDYAKEAPPALLEVWSKFDFLRIWVSEQEALTMRSWISSREKVVYSDWIVDKPDKMKADLVRFENIQCRYNVEQQIRYFKRADKQDVSEFRDLAIEDSGFKTETKKTVRRQ